MTQTSDSVTTSVETAAAGALAAAPALAALPLERRAHLLRSAADAIDANAPELVPIAERETGISTDRLRGEATRTSRQLRLFADAVEEGSFLEVAIDHADPGAVPPQPDLRRMLVPLGPVAVYAASNFPFAFSVAGGDTASALAAGAPVVVKTHPGHPELSERTARIVVDALTAAGAPDGTLTTVSGFDAGLALVTHPAIRAAAFTGSTAGGRALFDLASGRPDPIPFYGELGSVNPVVVTPAAMAERGAALADGLIASVLTSLGQLCTKPGLVFVPRDSGFEQLVAERLPAQRGRLLTAAISSAFEDRVTSARTVRGVHVVAGDPGDVTMPGAIVLGATASTVRDHPELLEETFGPTTLLVAYDDLAEVADLVDRVGGSLTATAHLGDGEGSLPIVEHLTRVAGRVLFDGWPTGVAVTWSQQHGGPWPATTALHTSVGVTAVRRFLRPLVYQSAPAAILPPPLRDDNPLAIPRRVDGILELPAR